MSISLHKPGSWEQTGYALDVIPGNHRRVLLTRINEEFRRDFNSERIREYEVSTFFPKLAASADMRAYAADFASRGMLKEIGTGLTCDSVQIALRFPGGNMVEPNWHIDGIPYAGNGVTTDAGPQCKAILGIYLSDVEREGDGELQIAPGSHLQVEEFARKHGWSTLRKGALPEVQNRLSIWGKAGTAIIMHPQMIHRVMPNRSTNIRYAVYFRYYQR